MPLFDRIIDAKREDAEAREKFEQFYWDKCRYFYPQLDYARNELDNIFTTTNLGRTNCIHPITFQPDEGMAWMRAGNDNWADDLKLRHTQYLREIDWDARTVNELNKLDLNYAQQLFLDDKVPYDMPGYGAVEEKLTVTVTIPTNKRFLPRDNARLVLYLTSSGSESIITDLTAKKNINNPKLRWLFETCYTVSINWNKDKYYGWGTRPPARMLFGVIVEL